MNSSRKNSLQGKHVLITGASSGIGEKTAVEAAKQGAKVILLARNLKRLEHVADQVFRITKRSPDLHVVDVRHEQKVQEVFSDIFENHHHIDILMNNAGFGYFEEFHVSDMEKVKEMFEVNVLGLMNCTRLTLPNMLESNRGHIINVASQAGKLATPKSTGYSASKHAVLGFTNSLRIELADTNIHVSSVNPGPIRTPFFDIADSSGQYVKSVNRFMLDPDDVARKIVALMGNPKRELNVPGWMNTASKIYHIMPAVIEKVGGRFFKMK